MRDILEIFIPIFIPDTILALNVPLRVMSEAIYNFNKKVMNEGLVLTENGETLGKVELIIRFGDNLFLCTRIEDSWESRKEQLGARLMGYVIMNKESGVVEDLVIEGFTILVAKTPLDFSGSI
jgi:hypothetical protein